MSKTCIFKSWYIVTKDSVVQWNMKIIWILCLFPPLFALSGRFVCVSGGWWFRLCCQCELPVHTQSRQLCVMGVCSAWDSGTCILPAANTPDTSATGCTSPTLKKCQWIVYKTGSETLKILSHFFPLWPI